MKKSNSENPSNVVDFTNFKRSKEAEERFGRGRTPLSASHLEKEKPSQSPQVRNPEVGSQMGAIGTGPGDFGDRMRRIKASLEKINQLMIDLKKTTRKPELVDMD